MNGRSKRTVEAKAVLVLTVLCAGAGAAGFAPGPVEQDDEQKEWRVPRRKARVENPIEASKESLEVGRSVFERECLSCHGETGRGDGPAAKDLDRSPGNLTDPKMWKQTDGAIFWKVSTGRSPMPSFETLLSKEERWSVVNYVRTLAPREEPAATTPRPLKDVVDAYLELHGAMARDDYEASRTRASALSGAIKRLSRDGAPDVPENLRAEWASAVASLEKTTKPLDSADSLDGLRRIFAELSEQLLPPVRRFGHGQSGPLRVAHCPRARDGAGAVWLQRDAKASNPYLGVESLECGKIREVLPATRKHDDQQKREQLSGNRST